jgi:5,10-methylene-tetrahydrofolate dehydrogenase/methenyl tetrahydrofolate cyclohydrolase
VTVVIDPSEVAKAFRDKLRTRVASIGRPLKLVGLLATESAPSVTYARYTEKGCNDVGVTFELRKVGRVDAEREIERINADPRVHGLMIYYPVFGIEHDNYIKDQVTPEKDVEGLSSFWVRRLYRNQRFIDENQTKKAILPCTPLAIMKLLQVAGVLDGSGRPLEGKTITIFNRSEVVGRPLAAMLAHDGARVFSFDIGGPILFGPNGMAETSVSRADALGTSDVVVTGVPSRNFPLVRAEEIQSGAVCLNFSTFKNFDDSVEGKAGVFIARVGPMTVTMALRNTLRLYENFHADRAPGSAET